MIDNLTRLAILVLDAKALRRKAAERRCYASAEDEPECDRLDDLSEAARVDLENALWSFFQCWIDEQIAEQTQTDASAEGAVRQ